MSEMQFRIKLQYQPTEAESENDLNDGKNEYFWEKEEKRKSGVYRPWKENKVPTRKHQFNWLQQVSIRKLRVQFFRV